MNLHFSNGTDRQRQWVNDAIAGSSYPYNLLHVDVTVVFTSITNCNRIHTYMCTTGLGNHAYQIQVEPWADDPKNVNNSGLPDPYQDLHEFFVDTFIHETGHVVQDELLNTPEKIAAACAAFVHKPDGRRGTAADYSGTETTNSWPELICEAISEWFRLTFRPIPQVYWNRTNWHLAPGRNPLEGLPSGPPLRRKDPVTKKPIQPDKNGDYATVMQMLVPSGWKYGEAIILQGEVTYQESGLFVVNDSGGKVQLGRRALIEGKTFEGTQITNAPDFFAGGGLPNTFMGCDYTPSIFGRAPTWLGFNSPDGKADQTGETVNPFNDRDFGTIAVYDPHQPAGNSRFGYPGIARNDPLSWSGWHVRRAAKLAFSYARIPHSVREKGFHGWGVVEIQQSGRIVLDSIESGLIIHRSAVGFHGPLRPGAAGGDDGYPWVDINTVELGSGIQPDWVRRGPLQPGWYAALSLIDTVNFTVGHDFDHPGGSGGSGSTQYWVGASDVTIISPGEFAVGPPPPPIGGTGVVSKTDTTKGQLGIERDATWVALPILDVGENYMFACSPDRIGDEIDFIWMGFSAEVDNYSQIHGAAIFWPIIFYETGLPPYPFQNPGKISPGGIGNGSIRSTDAAPLAARKSQVVHRVSGSG